MLVNPGDLTVADHYGVIAAPARAVGDAVWLATEKAIKENGTRAGLINAACLRDVYARYGVL